MKVVLTGGLGFVGQNLAIHMRHLNPSIDLIAVDWFLGASPCERSLFDHVHHQCFSHPSSLEIYADADVLVHLAARTTVQESLLHPMATFENNVSKTQSVLEYLRLKAPGVKFIFASTGGAIIGDYDGAIHERIVPRPLSPYGASKLAVEGLLSAYHSSFGLQYASLRFSNIYGPNSGRKSSVVAAFCQMYLEKCQLQINGDGAQTRDYIYVRDVATAIAETIANDLTGVFQIGTGTPTSIADLIEIFRQINKENPKDGCLKILHAPALQGEVRHNVADISKLRKAIGFAPKNSIEDGIWKTLQWFREQQETQVEERVG